MTDSFQRRSRGPVPPPGSRFCIFAVLLLLLAFPGVGQGEGATPQEHPRIRRPAAAVVSADGKLLYVANRQSGSISVVDLAGQRVVAEHDVGRQLSDLATNRNRSLLLASDQAAHQVIALRADGGDLQVVGRQSLARFPARIVMGPDDRVAVVASLWSRRLTVLRVPANVSAMLPVAGDIELPFAPRELLVLDDGQTLLAADAFGGRLAIVDTREMKLRATRELPAHNIRGLHQSPDGERLVIAHQILSESAQTLHPDIHWGMLMGNHLRWLRRDEVVSADGDLFEGSHIHALGQTGRGAGTREGSRWRATVRSSWRLSGVDQVAVGREHDFSLTRVRVGRRPTRVTLSRDDRQAYVVNTHSDSISVVDLESPRVTAEISLGPQPELSASQRGELLFYAARFSHDGWMSCHSCHTDGHTIGLRNDNLSDGSFGAPKQILSLLGLADTAPYAWDGSTTDLQAQIRKSMTKTMRSDREPTDEQVADLAAFVRTLPAAPAAGVLGPERDEEAVARGQKLFHELRCNRCHKPPSYTTPRTYDVGLHDELGNRRFNPPSLRGVSQRGPYFHDNRAERLRDVFLDHGHQLKRDVSSPELDDLVTFLRTL